MKFDVFVIPNAHCFSLIRSCTIKHHGTDTSFLLEAGETRKTNRGDLALHGSTRASLSPIFRLFKITHVKYVMPISCIQKFFCDDTWRCFNSLIECLYVALLTPTVMMMKGFIFHPKFLRIVVSGSYCVCVCFPPLNL